MKRALQTMTLTLLCLLLLASVAPSVAAVPEETAPVETPLAESVPVEALPEEIADLETPLAEPANSETQPETPADVEAIPATPDDVEVIPETPADTETQPAEAGVAEGELEPDSEGLPLNSTMSMAPMALAPIRAPNVFVLTRDDTGEVVAEFDNTPEGINGVLAQLKLIEGTGLAHTLTLNDNMVLPDELFFGFNKSIQSKQR